MHVDHSEESLVGLIEVDKVKERCSRVVAEVSKEEQALVFVEHERPIEDLERSHHRNECQEVSAWIGTGKPRGDHQETEAIHEEVFVQLPSEGCVC